MTESSPILDASSNDREGAFEWSIRPSVGRPGAMVFAVSTIVIMSSLIGVMGGDFQSQVWQTPSAPSILFCQLRIGACAS